MENGNGEAKKTVQQLAIDLGVLRNEVKEVASVLTLLGNPCGRLLPMRCFLFKSMMKLIK